MDIDISWVDLVLGAVVVVSLLVGLWRGLVYEVLSLAGWVVAYLGAPFVAPVVAGWLPAERMTPQVLQVASLVLSFVLIVFVWSLAAKLVRALIQATPLSMVDRLFGAGFGVLRGLLVCLLLVVVVSMTPVARSTTWQASTVAPWLVALLHGVEPLLPAAVVELIPVRAKSAGL